MILHSLKLLSQQLLSLVSAKKKTIRFCMFRSTNFQNLFLKNLHLIVNFLAFTSAIKLPRTSNLFAGIVTRIQGFGKYLDTSKVSQFLRTTVVYPITNSDVS